MSSPVLYGLDKRGAELLRLEFGYEGLHWFASMKELKDEFLEHTLAIADFRIAVTIACQRTGYRLLTWHGETELKADYDRVTIRTDKGSRAVSVIPDGYFAIETPLGKAHFFLEVDRGTMTVGRFRDKVAAYIAYYQQGYQHRYGTKSLRILTVTVGEQRLTNLKRVTEQILGTHWFWFSLSSKVDAAHILNAAVWQVVGREGFQTLIESPLPT